MLTMNRFSAGLIIWFGKANVPVAWAARTASNIPAFIGSGGPPRSTSARPLTSFRCNTSRIASFLSAKPKRGAVIDSYQTVSVNCSKCGERLFRYKKKNGTKSNLVKCFIERISEDSAGLLKKNQAEGSTTTTKDSDTPATEWHCPKCDTKFARSALIRGLPALKLVGGKVRMTKK